MGLQNFNHFNDLLESLMYGASIHAFIFSNFFLAHTTSIAVLALVSERFEDSRGHYMHSFQTSSG